MTADHAHTPTTEVVKDAACFPRDRLGEPRGIDTDAFDRWLATIEVAAERRGAERAFKESANEVRSEMRWQYAQNINRNSDTGDSIDRLLELEKVFTYRADQEGDE